MVVFVWDEGGVAWCNGGVTGPDNPECGPDNLSDDGPGRPQSAPLGPVASSGALRAFLAAAIGQVPRILDAEPAAATRRHHALLERGEGAGGAVVAVVAALLDARSFR